MGPYVWDREEDGWVIRAGDGVPLAGVWEGNPAVDPLPRGELPPVCWTGWNGEARPPDGWYERTAAAWLPSAAAERDAVIERLVAAGAILRPHARHLVSDTPACLHLLRRHEGVRLLLEPAALLEPSMMDRAADHIERMLAALGPSAWGVVVSDAAVRTDGADSWCVSVGCGDGGLDTDHLGEMAADLAPAARLIVRPPDS